MNEENNSLTIAIPTFNRPCELKKTLSIILPQIAECKDVFLLVQDNYSETPAQDIYESLNFAISSNRVRFVRNNLNIGGNANIMRCFENCQTKWLWVLGDDDLPSTSAINTIMKDGELDHCFAFYTVPKIKKPYFNNEVVNNLIGFGFENLISHFGRKNKLEIGFLSAAIFNMNLIRPYIIDGYLTANTGLPHILMVVKALTAGHKWMISKEVIADYCPPSSGSGWGFMSYAYAMTSLLGVASKNQEIALLRDILIKGWRPSPKKILYSQITNSLDDEISRRDLRYIFCTIKDIYSPSWFEDPALRLRWTITLIWSYFPITFATRYKKRKESNANINLTNTERR